MESHPNARMPISTNTPTDSSSVDRLMPGVLPPPPPPEVPPPRFPSRDVSRRHPGAGTRAVARPPPPEVPPPCVPSRDVSRCHPGRAPPPAPPPPPPHPPTPPRRP